MQTLLETFRPDERRLVSVQLSPYLEWWVADGRRRERLSRSDVSFDVPESMRETVLGLPHRATIRRAAEELVRTDSPGVAVLFDGTEVIALVPACRAKACTGRPKTAFFFCRRRRAQSPRR